MDKIKQKMTEAAQAGNLTGETPDNIMKLLAGADTTLYAQAVEELLDGGHYQELQDRFFKTLAFGTGGLRGRSIGGVVTKVEMGTPGPLGRPEHACVGTNALNPYNIARATRGLVGYLKDLLVSRGQTEKPRLAISRDVRHFSKEFAELTAEVASRCGCDVVLFEKPRSTPELSFLVRLKRAHAGVMITASHNPPHDSGYKAYFEDGAQIIEPHASGIIARVNAITSEIYEPVPEPDRGLITRVGTEIDEAYLERLETVVLEPENLRVHAPKTVFTPLHGTGQAIVPTLLERLGVPCEVEPEQARPDGRFPTVESPNPEYPAALERAIDLARKTGASLVLGTDPDADRLGVAALNDAGEFQCLTGNQIGSLLAWNRLDALTRQGVLTEENISRVTLIKTFVSSDLQDTIAARFGARCVNTLTGFKYIGAKLAKYEAALPEEFRNRYRDLSETETRRLRLEHSTYFVFGGEESYGYSGADFVRDKDANAAAAMVCEAAARAAALGLTLPGLLDKIFREFGYFAERTQSMTLEGAKGAAQIARLMESYSNQPPTEIGGVRVARVRNFARDEMTDSEGDRLPKENLLLMELEEGGKAAVRPSGTEPKIKYYLFAWRLPGPGAEFSASELDDLKREVEAHLDRLWEALKTDAGARLKEG